MRAGGNERPSEAKRLPGGWITRAVLVVVFALAWTDFSTDPWIDLSTVGGWVVVISPLVPIIALCFGAVPGTIGLLVALVMLNVFIRVGGSGFQFVQVMISTVAVGGLASYMLPLRQARAFAVVGAGLIALTIVGRFALEALYPAALLLLVFVLAVAAGLGSSVYRSRAAKDRARIVELEEREERIRGEERMRLAHELHDIVAHDVTIIAMQARRAAVVTDPAKTASIIDGIAASAQQALNDMRSLVLLLKEDAPSAPSRDVLDAPPAPGTIVGTTGLAHDLDAITDALERAGFATTLAIHGELALIPTALRQALRRTARELGTNILKHADPGNPVAIALTVTDSTVTMTTRNTPASGRPVSSSHTGFEAMRARALLLGGTLRSGSSDNTWTTTLTVPLTGRLMTDASRKENE